MTHDMVIERLLEAWGFMRRMPDREAVWLRPSAGVSSLYAQRPLTARDAWSLWGYAEDGPDKDARPKMPGLRTVEVDRMTVALSWIEYVDARDRKLVGAVLKQLDQGAARPSWTAIGATLGLDVHRETLAKRWDRAISRIALKLNR